MTEHPQTRFGGVEVDAAMVPLLRELWRCEIRTVASCQSWSVIGGAAYVGFVTEEDYEAFEEVVDSASTVLVAGQPDDAFRAKLSDPAFLEDVAEKGGCWFVGFPPGDLHAVTRAFGPLVGHSLAGYRPDPSTENRV